MAMRTVKVKEIFDDSHFTAYQYVVCGLCFLVTFLDGFDMAVIGVVLPKIGEYLHAQPAALGIALTAGQFGPLIGGIVLGMFADRWGRKWVLFASASVFGIFALLTAFIGNVEQLAVCRLLTGFGLGGAITLAITFGSEYAPSRSRATLAATMYAGVPIGAMMTGFAAAWLIPRYGWQSLLIVGGGAPIVIALAVAAFLPESLEFLVLKGKDEKQIRGIVGRISPAIAKDVEVRFVPSEQKLPGVSVKRLFTEDRALTTILCCVLWFGAMYVLWILNAWLPTLLKKSGASIQQYSYAFAFYSLGAFLASIYIGRLMDKVNPVAVLEVGFVLAFASLLVFGFTASGPFILIAVVSIVCGICINGSQTGTFALPALFYPSDIRGTAMGWAYGIAKLGAAGAPLVGGYLLSRNYSVSQICGINALVGLILAGVALVLHRHLALARHRSALGATAA